MCPQFTALRTSQSSNGRVVKYSIDADASPLSYAEVLVRWQEDEEFCRFFNDLLLTSTFSAFRWETPPITTATAKRAFEFVLLDSPYLARDPDPSAFAEHFAGAGSQTVVEFPNLGNDAIMVAPRPDSLSDYGHLAAFLQNSAATQRYSLWQLVATAMQRRLSMKPVWLSTAGGGVAWLHVRLDDGPKYYGYEPYRRAP